jgi:hypothetical protein
MSDSGKDELKALVVRARQEKQGPFPETLRQRVLRYALERWRAGVPVKTVAEEIGVSGATLSYWRSQVTAGRHEKLRPVKVVERAPHRAYTVRGPCGTHVDGLSLDEIAELFRKLT